MTRAPDGKAGLESQPARAPRPASARGVRIVTVSLSLHLVLIAVLAHRSRVWIAPVRLPGTAHGTRMVLTYLPGSRAFAAAGVASARRGPARPLRAARVAAPSPAVPASPAETLQQNPGSGADALGEGDVSIALMQFFPDPQPDLTRLPHGSRGDVVLEAVISAEGRIAQLTVKQGLGYGVDESVVATVAQWTFLPALRDGKPVASQQEFHFHYERG